MWEKGLKNKAVLLFFPNIIHRSHINGSYPQSYPQFPQNLIENYALFVGNDEALAIIIKMEETRLVFP